MLVLAALVVLTLSLVAAAMMRRGLAGGGDPDLGWVSERWLAEHRADSARPSP